MAYSGLSEFISALEQAGELHRIKAFADPVLEITEITDRVTKTGGKALLFENTGTEFPLLINAFGSDRRMAMAIGKSDLGESARDIEEIFNIVTEEPGSLYDRILKLPRFLKMAGWLPARKRNRGKCQEKIIHNPDLSVLPVLKCWPFDGGRFITLPMVHTIHPLTGKSNVGMYRMQILGMDTTGMHWQRHKTGANHFEAYKTLGKRMPVSVALGGDPIYTYSATAPLPENINEYILAGFLRRKRVTLVRCITNDLYVPSDADIVLEGYIDPKEEMISEGPFGDHTGFYSLADLYPVFHITCITHRQDAAYPATIVGIPPQEDAWLAKATEKIFLAPVRLALLPEIEDFHMPVAGVAHNLLIVRIKKKYPGQGMKVINSLFGAGQMMFSKYLVVVSGNVNIRDYSALMKHIFENVSYSSDILFTRGPLDVLDHSSDTFSFGGKAGIDATIKQPEEIIPDRLNGHRQTGTVVSITEDLFRVPLIKSVNLDLMKNGFEILILTINPSEDPESIKKVTEHLKKVHVKIDCRLIIAVDDTVDPYDIFTVAWQLLGNSDPLRDHYIISPETILIDGTIKYYRSGGFKRNWPNIVCSDTITIDRIDKRWDSFGFNSFIPSPSLKSIKLQRKGADSIDD